MLVQVLNWSRRGEESGKKTYHVENTWVYLQALETTSLRELFLQSSRRRLWLSSSPLLLLSIFKRCSCDEPDDIADSNDSGDEEQDEIPTGLVPPRAFSLYDEVLLELERPRGIPCSYDAEYGCRLVWSLIRGVVRGGVAAAGLGYGPVSGPVFLDRLHRFRHKYKDC